MKKIMKKFVRALFLVNGLEFLLGAALLAALLSRMIVYSEQVLYLVLALVLLCSLLSLISLFSVSTWQRQGYEESIRNLEQLNRKLREQRHDSMNQLQIVYGLLELEEYQEAASYLRPIFKDVIKVNGALRTSQPAVNALLQAKLEEAGKQGIDLYLEVGSQLDQLPMEPWELCKILANLIDNALTAVSQKNGEKSVTVRVSESAAQYHISVRNNGPQIHQEQQRLIFGEGYTTKKGEGHGMGLVIVSSILRESGGEILVSSDTEETSFDVTLPKLKQEQPEKKTARRKWRVSSCSKNDN
jgi:sensor histidine kinase regulating citrate/malate metabolism